MSNSIAERAEATSNFEERISRIPCGNGDLYMLPTPVESMVSFKGSIETRPIVERGDLLLQRLTVGMLDKGTRKKDRFGIAEILENRGAELHLASEGLRVEFSGRCLTDHLSVVLDVAAEVLREPAFNADEFEKEKARLAASLQRSMESTSTQAAGALARRIYSSAHPNFVPAPEDALRKLQTLDVEDSRAYHEQHFGSDGLIVVLVGDIDESDAAGKVTGAFADWQLHGLADSFEPESVDRSDGRTVVEMRDRFNLDVRMGHGVRVRRNDDDYIPVFIGNHILGGNFSARLMTHIRDELGLTYGIGSSLVDVGVRNEGHWQIGVTLSRERLEEGIEATVAEVKKFLAEGANTSELEDKKTTIAGSFKVGLATTGGLSSAILANAERGFDMSYLDEFPAIIGRMTLEQVNDAVGRYLDAEAFHIAVAGTVAEYAPGNDKMQ